jgi:aryl carrier-like protein
MSEDIATAGAGIAGREDFYRAVREMLGSMNAEEGEAAAAAEIGENENLFDAGLLTSFSLVHLVARLRESIGVSIDFSTRQMEDFFTLRSLYGVFAGEAE